MAANREYLYQSGFKTHHWIHGGHVYANMRPYEEG